MALFGKKQEEVEEDIEEFEEGRKITRKLKDLNPENKKKRKEPPKPWGRKERIIIFLVLLATTLISAILLFSNSFGYKTKKLELKFPNFNLNSINMFKGETIVVEKGTK